MGTSITSPRCLACSIATMAVSMAMHMHTSRPPFELTLTLVVCSQIHERWVRVALLCTARIAHTIHEIFRCKLDSVCPPHHKSTLASASWATLEARTRIMCSCVSFNTTNRPPIIPHPRSLPAIQLEHTGTFASALRRRARVCPSSIHGVCVRRAICRGPVSVIAGDVRRTASPATTVVCMVAGCVLVLLVRGAYCSLSSFCASRHECHAPSGWRSWTMRLPSRHPDTRIYCVGVLAVQPWRLSRSISCIKETSVMTVT